MDQYHLDGVFQALADPTRRGVIAQLARGPASVGALAEPFAMALPSFLKHIHTLEDCGLIRTSKQGRVRICEIDPERFSAVQGWLDEQRSIWERRTDRLEKLVTDNQQQGSTS